VTLAVDQSVPCLDPDCGAACDREGAPA